MNNIQVLVAGASGATGKHLVHQLLLKGNKVKIIVRSTRHLPESWFGDSNVEIITASISELGDQELDGYVSDCDAIASCLGHSLSFKGVYGQPRKLVTDTVKRLCNAIQKQRPESPVKFVLMNSSGVRNRD